MYTALSHSTTWWLNSLLKILTEEPFLCKESIWWHPFQSKFTSSQRALFSFMLLLASQESRTDPAEPTMRQDYFFYLKLENGTQHRGLRLPFLP